MIDLLNYCFPCSCTGPYQGPRCSEKYTTELSNADIGLIAALASVVAVTLLGYAAYRFLCKPNAPVSLIAIGCHTK